MNNLTTTVMSSCFHAHILVVGVINRSVESKFGVNFVAQSLAFEVLMDKFLLENLMTISLIGKIYLKIIRF